LLFEKGKAAGEAEEALRYFLSAVELDPQLAALNNAGVILLGREGGAERALELFRKAAAWVRMP
jgi:Flp pilus assembly protein TadD